MRTTSRFTQRAAEDYVAEMIRRMKTTDDEMGSVDPDSLHAPIEDMEPLEREAVQGYLQHGEPLPADLYFQLRADGIDPDSLMDHYGL